MSIIRVEKSDRFTHIDNRLIEDKRLSWETLGVLVFLLSKPNNWRISRAHLINELRSAGKDKVTRILKELADTGYYVRRRVQVAGGRIEWENVIRECADSPLPDFPATAEPATAQPSVDNPPLVKTERINTDLTSTEKKRGPHSIPKDFMLTDKDIAFAQKHGISVWMEELDKFTDYYKARGTRWQDWHAVWRTWCRNAQTFAARNDAAEHARKYPTADELDARRNGHS